MKRILTSALLLTLAVGAGAQGWTDALTYSENDYLGTARSLGMGNAMTAVGGDLGSLTFNPAGSAVSGYSQFTISPGLSISTVVGQGSLEHASGSLLGFQDRVKTPMTRMQMPNIGAIMIHDTRNKRGLRRVAFGIVGNMTRDYTSRLRATGTNVYTTLAASLASQADGYLGSELSGSFYGSDIPSWETMAGWQAGLINPIPGRDAAYYGLTERILANGDISLADEIGQYYGLQRSGSKYDLLMNLGLDFNDKFYLGANIGLTSLNYRSDETRSEEALSGRDYPSGFQSLRVRLPSEKNAVAPHDKADRVLRFGLRIRSFRDLDRHACGLRILVVRVARRLVPDIVGSRLGPGRDLLAPSGGRSRCLRPEGILHLAAGRFAGNRHKRFIRSVIRAVVCGHSRRNRRTAL